MSVLLETNLGDIVIDLLYNECPRTCLNFLKLCKVKYYNFAPFYNIQKDFTCQTGDRDFPKGDGGTSIWGLIRRQTSFFEPDSSEKRHHDRIGTVSMATTKSQAGHGRMAGSQFIITLTEESNERLDERASIFGYVIEGLDTLEKINNAYCDDKGRPLKDIRIRHTYILEDPFDDPEGLQVPSESPGPSEIQLSTVRLGDNDEIGRDLSGQEAFADEKKKAREMRAQALTLEIVGDLPFADVKPEENVLFVCKLNPVTQDEDLELIFSRFGKIRSCQIVRDKITGESLQYAFIEYETKADCERAYFKMEGVLIDDCRIHVDFSQSVAKLVPDSSNNNRRQTRQDKRSYFGRQRHDSSNSDGRSKDRHSKISNHFSDDEAVCSRNYSQDKIDPRYRDEFEKRNKEGSVERERRVYQGGDYREREDSRHGRDRRHHRDRQQDRQHRDRRYDSERDGDKYNRDGHYRERDSINKVGQKDHRDRHNYRDRSDYWEKDRKRARKDL